MWRKFDRLAEELRALLGEVRAEEGTDPGPFAKVGLDILSNLADRAYRVAYEGARVQRELEWLEQDGVSAFIILSSLPLPLREGLSDTLVAIGELRATARGMVTVLEAFPFLDSARVARRLCELGMAEFDWYYERFVTPTAQSTEERQAGEVMQ